MADRKTLEQHNIEHNITVEGPFSCDNCGKVLPAFALADASDEDDLEGDFVCGSCFIDLERARVSAQEVHYQLTWADVRSFRSRLLQQCDWTQTFDVSETVRAHWSPIRASMRDITETASTPQEAWGVLKQIEQNEFM